jgi:hypothetical protein
VIAAQLSLVPMPNLPLRPEELITLAPKERGRIYNACDLDSFQRQAAESARRMVLAGIYPEGVPR